MKTSMIVSCLRAIGIAYLATSLVGCTKHTSSTGPAVWSSTHESSARAQPGFTERITTWNEPEAADSRQYAYRLPGMECLVNQYGIRRKVIVTQPNVRCLSDPSGGISTGPTLRFFMPYFVFDVSPEEGDIAFFQIGPTPQRDSIIGWVAASQATPWDTRVGARYQRTRGTRTPPLLVYKSYEALEELVKNKTTEQQPIARANDDGSRTWMPWPIAETRRFHWQERAYEFVRLNFLGEFREGGQLDDPAVQARAEGAYSAREIDEIKGDVKKLDLVFCMDTTQSTTPHINAMRDAVRMISRQLHDLPFRPDLSCSLVEYRDYVEGIMFSDESGNPSPVKVYSLETDLQRFLKRVASVREASGSSLDWPEAGYDGLHAALTRPQWRGGDLSTRVVVLIGDNSFHPPGSPNNPRGISGQDIIQLANRHNVRIFSLLVKGGGNAQERRRHRDQFSELAEGTGGECLELEGAEKIVAHIREILQKETAIVHTRSTVLDALAEGKTKDQIAAERQINIREVTEVMEFLAGGGVDLDRFQPGVPTFATGWCLVETGGVHLLDTEVYVARAELDMLLSELHSLCVHLSPDLARRAFRTGVGSRVNPMSFFAEHRPEPMDIFLMAKGIPCSQGLLKLTRSDIEHMSEERRAVLRERIARQVIPQLTNVRNADNVFTWLDDLEFGWIKESLLP